MLSAIKPHRLEYLEVLDLEKENLLNPTIEFYRNNNFVWKNVSKYHK